MLSLIFITETLDTVISFFILFFVANTPLFQFIVFCSDCILLSYLVCVPTAVTLTSFINAITPPKSGTMITTMHFLHHHCNVTPCIQYHAGLWQQVATRVCCKAQGITIGCQEQEEEDSSGEQVELLLSVADSHLLGLII